jgi:hypothetical protein
MWQFIVFGAGALTRHGVKVKPWPYWRSTNNAKYPVFL